MTSSDRGAPLLGSTEGIVRDAGLSAEQLAAVVRAAGEAILVQRADHSVVFANDAAAAMLGFASGRALEGHSLAESIDEFVPLDDAGEPLPTERLPVRRVIAGEPEARAIVRLHSKRGGPDRSVSFTSTVMSNGDDARAAFVVTVLRDVTREKRADSALAFLSRASAVLGSSLDDAAVLAQLVGLCVPAIADWCGVFVLGSEGAAPLRLSATHLAPANPALSVQLDELLAARGAALGLDEVLATGQSLLAPEITPAMRARWCADPRARTLLEQLALQSLMIVPLAAHGVLRGVLALATANSNRNYDEADLGLAEDVAHRAALAIEHARVFAASRAAEATLARQAEELAAAVRVRDEFLAIASHELKTPLTSLQLNLDLLVRAVQTGEPLTQARATSIMDAAQRQHRRLARLVNELLDVSRIASGRLRLELEMVDLAALTRHVTDRFLPEMEALGATLRLRVDPSVVGQWDRLRIEQVVSHLVSNAVRYGRRRPVDVTVRREGECARLEVCDEGIGIATDACARIFGRFERAASAHNYGGLGLGLYIVRQIVDAHGGSIAVASHPGEGSRFTVELPLGGAPSH